MESFLQALGHSAQALRAKGSASVSPSCPLVGSSSGTLRAEIDPIWQCPQPRRREAHPQQGILGKERSRRRNGLSHSRRGSQALASEPLALKLPSDRPVATLDVHTILELSVPYCRISAQRNQCPSLPRVTHSDRRGTSTQGPCSTQGSSLGKHF